MTPAFDWKITLAGQDLRSCLWVCALLRLALLWLL